MMVTMWTTNTNSIIAANMLIFSIFSCRCFASPKLDIVINNQAASLVVVKKVPSHLKSTVSLGTYMSKGINNSEVLIPLSTTPIQYGILRFVNVLRRKIPHKCEELPMSAAATRVMAIDIPVFHTSMSVWKYSLSPIQSLSDYERLLKKYGWSSINSLSYSSKLMMHLHKAGNTLKLHATRIDGYTVITSWLNYIM